VRKLFGFYCAKKAVNALYNKYSSATNNFLPDLRKSLVDEFVMFLLMGVMDGCDE